MTGADRLRAKLLAVVPACEDAAAEAVKQSAQAARDVAASLAPVDTGRLRGSIEASAEGLSAEVTAGCDYAAAVELGGRAPARPFLLPAAQAAALTFPALARRLAANAIRRMR